MRVAVMLALACAGCSSLLGLPEGELASMPDAPLPDALVLYTLSIRKDPTETGMGTMTADFGNTTCAGDCPSTMVDVPAGTLVTIEAKPVAGSFFQGWSGACSGSYRFCTVMVDQARTVTATFMATTHNLIFVSSEQVPPNFGGVAEADKICRDAAAGAGLSGTFVALLSAPGTNAMDRLVMPAGGAARGWIRPDGKPVTDTVVNMLTDHVFWYPVSLDENGRQRLSYVWSGSDRNGALSPMTCNGWTSTSPDVVGAIGLPQGGPLLLGEISVRCGSLVASVLCAQVDKAAPVTAPAPQTGKVLFVSKAGLAPGPGGKLAADALCTAEKPASAGTVKALLATTSGAPSSLVAMAATYVRPDGLVIGKGSELIAGTLQTGPWVHADGSSNPVMEVSWRGSATFNRAAVTADENCGDWKSSSVNGVVGFLSIGDVNGGGWWQTGGSGCSGSLPILCIEQ